MNSIKKQFSELRKNTPKHIQWLLLIAAFIVVLILLTLLLTKKENAEIKNSDDIAITLNISPDSVNWGNTLVGEKEKQTIKISASAPVKILNVYRNKDIAGLPDPQQTCTNIKQIDTNNLCTIVLEYQPTAKAATETIDLYIDWRGINEPDVLKKTSKIILVLGAEEPVIPEPEKKAEPVQEIEKSTKPVIEEKISYETVIEEPSPVQSEAKPEIKEEIKEEIKSISPTNVFTEEKISSQSVSSESMEYSLPAETCSDFAFPGYNLSGVQSGWIRPEGGAYYFHPFSDKNCDSPTGIYNPDTGLITDINNNGQKIGTDAEHIGYVAITNGALPQLSNPASKKEVNKARQLTTEELKNLQISQETTGDTIMHIVEKDTSVPIIGTSSKTAVYSSDPFDRKFVLRQYKPIPATIVSEVRADPSLYNCADGSDCSSKNTLPVRATVDRNVYSDDGRTIIIPTGTLLLGYVTGELPGPYKSIGRMQINWYQFVLPNGVEFNFQGTNPPFSGDSQGRVGVPGHGSTDYVEQIVMPMLTAIVPAAVNMIAPIADTFVNQIDLDNNTVVQSGTVRSSELAKNEIITAWNQVAQKLLVDAMDNTIPPFSIAAGTRITVFSPTDLVITCGTGNSKECSVENVQEATNIKNRNERNDDWQQNAKVIVEYNDPSWVGQVRSFNLEPYCINENNVWTINEDKIGEIYNSGYDYRTVLAYCQSLNYQAINNAKQDALYQKQQEVFSNTYSGTTSSGSNNTISGLTGISGSQSYNEDILGLTYNDDGTIQNPFQTSGSQTTQPAETVVSIITCDENGTLPDEYGCCPGEIYTDMGEELGFNCCPETGGDCFPPIQY